MSMSGVVAGELDVEDPLFQERSAKDEHTFVFSPLTESLLLMQGPAKDDSNPYECIVSTEENQKEEITIRMNAIYLYVTTTSSSSTTTTSSAKSDAGSSTKTVLSGKLRKCILSNISATIAPKRLVAIMGGSGSGITGY
jgi:ABC-type glutathione transport system ATPase component